MAELLQMCFAFLKTGLFAVGGGLATLPFLNHIAETHPDWFTVSDLANIVAVAESTPGPIGINMSTFAGFKNFGFLGGILSTLSLVAPSFFVVLIISGFWEKYRENEKVQKVFSALRAAAIGLIFSAGFSVFLSAVFPEFDDNSILHIFSYLNWKCMLIFTAVTAIMQIKKIKKLHPILFISLGAVLGILFKL